MPVKINLDDVTETISLDECHEQLIERKFDPEDQDSFISVAPILKRLNNNRDFLVERICDELEAHCRDQEVTNKYTPQVIMLKPAQKGVPFFMRANIWLPGSAQLLKVSGERSFFYYVPHDHNFNFLTSGYLGPGYGSDYYEYDYESVVGFPGEEVPLRFVEKSHLREGEMMLYRAYLDVHNQLPAERLSVSLNIMPATPFAHLRPQYIFDDTCARISSPIATSDSSMEPLMHLAAEDGRPRCMEILNDLAAGSCIELDRYRAIKALVSAQSTDEGRSAVIETYGLTSSSRQVAEMSRQLAQSFQALA